MKPEEELGELLKHNNYTVSTAESCTGGLVSSKLTDVSGSSQYVKLNFVTYSNDAKIKILNVKPETLDKYGAVSQECAYEMAQGLSDAVNSDVVICTTGIAGPTGGTAEKPVGLMYAAVKCKNIITVKKILINDLTDRIEIKNRFANEAIKLAISILSESRLA